MTVTGADVDQALDGFADGFSFQCRSPVLGTPADLGLAYEDVTFPSSDGVPLEAWFIPAPGARTAVIVNHPMGFTRSGLPADQLPWRSVWEPSGNAISVDLKPDYRILHDAGHHVLAYDLRSHGLSGAANGSLATSGIYEARDVVGSLEYVRRRADTADAAIALFSRCLGASSTFAAMTQRPESFDDVRCLLAVQPVTAKIILHRRLAGLGLGNHIDDLERRIELRTGILFAPRSPQCWARNVRVPTYLYAVRDDVLTDPSDVQTMFDNIAVDDKELHWIEGTTARFDGYLEFQRRPEPMLDWMATRLA